MQEGEDEDEDETPSQQLAYSLLQHYIQGVEAKDRTVRYRCVQLIALLVNHLPAIDDEVFVELKDLLIRRLHDKESVVRVHAVVALTRLQGAAEEGSEEGQEMFRALVERLKHDPQAEVRRAVLINIEPTTRCLPYILERSRDQDTLTRRAVYLRPMEEVDFRVLKIRDRESLLDHGLEDRDASVRRACANLLSGHWLHLSDDDLIKLLERLDVGNGKVASKALETFFDLYPDILSGLTYEEATWTAMKAEHAFLIRTFTEHCHRHDQTSKLDQVLPDISTQAYFIRNETGEERQELVADELSFILRQFLGIARLADYSDEMGRRNMFTLMRQMLIKLGPEEELIRAVMEVMVRICVDERDFTQTIVEIISDLREEEGGGEDEKGEEEGEEEGNKETKETEKVHRLLKSLEMARCMFENLRGSLQQSTSVPGLLQELVLPAAVHPHLEVREVAVTCLGLACYLDKRLAAQRMELFLHVVRYGHLELQIMALKIVFDLVMLFGFQALSTSLEDPHEIFRLIADCSGEGETTIQTLAVHGVSKLLLADLLDDQQALKSLVLLYFHPSSTDNARLRQCLSFFLQAFGRMAYKNHDRLCEVSLYERGSLLLPYLSLSVTIFL
ncbi:nuclear condensing complex subunit, C-term domain-containing protein [Piptocephalis cylindrospora]|uniref:Nuclear condensing complex subunit, C-term domain-containing protein n=1 Tax=Piptocephalis cylindrospora TaxID=1907219 RepID=A0A4P9Y387_9FUNG|nr:nuclear condensing complex subunit, C-term domain-containing protein [Piptocephalis cylindrospora]|eukprot:RKP13263.1 nuclear condensing complex subunit, C-term domain-containing protein [Piptocephalis cylindrospora]